MDDDQLLAMLEDDISWTGEFDYGFATDPNLHRALQRAYDRSYKGHDVFSITGQPGQTSTGDIAIGADQIRRLFDRLVWPLREPRGWRIVG